MGVKKNLNLTYVNSKYAYVYTSPSVIHKKKEKGDKGVVTNRVEFEFEFELSGVE